MFKSFNIVLTVCIICLFFSCGKDNAPVAIHPTPGNTDKSIYSDSVFFVQAADVAVKPISSQPGTYSSIPEGLKINENTGEIDVNQSETGLKYKVTFTPNNNGAAQSSYIVISGINYADKIYNLSAGDSIAAPVYNADAKLAIPGANSSSVFDDNGGCKKAGIILGGGDGKINLALSVRNQGIDTGATETVKMGYRISDGSNKTLNGLNVKIYFYRTASEIPQYLTDLLAARKAVAQEMAVVKTGSSLNSFASSGLVTNSAKAARPKTRPPCIIVVSR